jgi:epoxyqueuosine reductase
MRCQLACPVNRKQINNIVDGPSFSNEETNLLINGTAMADLQESLRSKLVRIALDDSGLVTARNLKFIIDNA